MQIPESTSMQQLENVDPNVRPAQIIPQKPKPKAVKYHRITYVAKDELESIPK